MPLIFTLVLCTLAVAAQECDMRASMLEFHHLTKHHLNRYAPGPGRLEWKTQPNPWRVWEGAQYTALPVPNMMEEQEPPRSALETLSALLFDSFAISAWKQAGSSTWALRVNPSSGNLHAEEVYVVSPAVAGLCEKPSLFHYTARTHSLALLGSYQEDKFNLSSTLIVLTTIPWREAWKYGERAYRYCHHDVGHSLACLSISAGRLGFSSVLLSSYASSELDSLVGISTANALEPEFAEALVEIRAPGNHRSFKGELPSLQNRAAGIPNRLSPSMITWPHLSAAFEMSRKPRTEEGPALVPPIALAPVMSFPRNLLHQRRSAQEMDAVKSTMSRDSFLDILSKAMPKDQVPFDVLAGPPHVHLIIFVHRVVGLEPGLYCLVRNTQSGSVVGTLKERMHSKFLWQGVFDSHSFYLLEKGNFQKVAKTISCHQNIAADGTFSLGMIADMRGVVERWKYPRLFWECGIIGQVLYLEAERHGLRGTGIGCFHDDTMHALLGLDPQGDWQSLYHFAVGIPIIDERITTLPAYE